MTGDSTLLGRHRHRLLQLASVWTVAMAATVVAFPLAYSQFRTYDDEGTYLEALNYALHGSVYAHMQLEYGPAFINLESAVFWILHLAVSHDMGRLVTLIAWGASAGLGGTVAAKLTGRTSMGIVATCLGMLVLAPLVNEPLQPAILIEPLTVVAVLCVMIDHRSVRASLALGLVLGTLLVIKVNVGGLLLVAVVGYQWLAYWRANIASSIGLAVLLSSVLVVTAPLVGRPPVATFDLMYVMASVGVACAVWYSGRTHAVRGLRIGAVGVGASFGVGIELLAGLLRGNSLGQIAEATVLRPLAQARGLYIPVPDVGITGVVVAATAVLALLWARSVGRASGLGHPGVQLGDRELGRAAMAGPPYYNTSCASARHWLSPDSILNTASLAAAVAAVYGIAAGIPLAGLGCTSLAVVATADDHHDQCATSARVFLAVLATSMVVQAYPTAGSQLGFASFLVVLCAVVVLNRAAFGRAVQCRRIGSPVAEAGPPLRIRGLGRYLSRGGPRRGPAPSGSAVGLPARMVGAIAVAMFLAAAAVGWRDYLASPPLNLRGSQWIHLPAADADPLEQVVRYVRVHCGYLVAMPSMASFYLWSRVTPPGGFVMPDGGLWLQRSYQQRAADTIASVPRLCVVFSPSVAAVYHQGSSLPQRGPLVRELRHGFQIVRTIGIYEIGVPVARIAVQSNQARQPLRLRAASTSADVKLVDRGVNS